MKALRVLVCLAGVAGVVVLVPIVHRHPEATYGGAETRLLALEAAAALSLLLIAATGRRGVATVLLAVAGALWMVPEIAGAAGVDLRLRTVSDSLGPVIVALLLLALILLAGQVSVRLRPAVLVAALG